MRDRGSTEKIMLEAVLGNVWGGGGVICQMAAWDCADLQMGPAGLHTSALGTQPPCWPLGREESWGQCLDLSSVSSLGGEEQGCRSLGNDQ